MALRPKFRRDGGFSLVEVLLGATLLGAIIIAWGGFVRDFSAANKRGRHDQYLARENQAVVALARTIPRRAVAQIECAVRHLVPMGPNCNIPGGCPLMHPYTWVTPVQDECVKRADPNPHRPNYVPNTVVFSQELWAWPLIGNRYGRGGNRDELNFELDLNYFNATLVPRMQNAGCMECHQGGHPDMPAYIRNCNFNLYNHVAGTGCGFNPPLATRLLFTSRMGQLFLPRRGTPAGQALNRSVSMFLYNPLGTGNPGAILSETLRAMGANIQTQPVRTALEFDWRNVSLGPGGFRIERRVRNGCTCVGSNVSPGCGPPAALCPGGGTLVAGTCTPGCNNPTTHCSCGKDCWRACYECPAGNEFAEYDCRYPGAGNFTVPRVIISSQTLDPDPGRNAIKHVNSTVVTP